MRLVKGLLCVSSLLWLTAAPSIASGIYNFTSAPVSYDSTLLTLGFVFTTNVPLTVTSLGYFDDGGDGFASAHTVGIYDDSGALIYSIVLDAGTIETLDGQFRYRSIVPIVLAAGKTYTIAATTGGAADGWAYGSVGGTVGKELLGLTVDPSITIAGDASRFDDVSGASLQYPVAHFDYTLYAGPNFIATASSGGSAVPEPGTLALVLTGSALAALGLVKKRKA
jgi:hypothetical protein